MKRLNTHGNRIQSTFNHHGGVLCLYPEGTRQLTKCNQEVFIARSDASNNSFFKRSNDEITDLIKSDIYPNPTSGLFSLQFSSEISGIFSLFNSMGGIVHQISIDRPEKQLDLNLELSNGLYYYEIQGVCAGKMVVQE